MRKQTAVQLYGLVYSTVLILCNVQYNIRIVLHLQFVYSQPSETRIHNTSVRILVVIWNDWLNNRHHYSNKHPFFFISIDGFYNLKFANTMNVKINVPMFQFQICTFEFCYVKYSLVITYINLYMTTSVLRPINVNLGCRTGAVIVVQYDTNPTRNTICIANCLLFLYFEHHQIRFIR